MHTFRVATERQQAIRSVVKRRARAVERGNVRCTLTSTETARRFYHAAGYIEGGPATSDFGTSSGYPMSKVLAMLTFDADAVEVELAIRDALHPTSGPKADIFVGLRDGGLKRVLNNRFSELKKEREGELLRGHGGAGGQRSAHAWTDDLKLDDNGAVCPILHNLILFLREHPKWKGVLGHDEFNNRVVIRKRPPWGDETPDAPWTDHHESLARVWFQCEDIAAALGDVGRAMQAAARHNPFHPVRDYLNALKWDGTPRLDTWLTRYLGVEDTPYSRATVAALKGRLARERQALGLNANGRME